MFDDGNNNYDYSSCSCKESTLEEDLMEPIVGNMDMTQLTRHNVHMVH